MRFLTILIDSLVSFVQRNPLTVLVILMLAIFAPWMLKGIAAFILYGLLGIVVAMAALGLYLRWKIAQAQRRMKEQFGEGFGPQNPYGQRQRRTASDEGEVKVYKTAETPEKRVSSDVGDYVEFEETKDR